MTIQARLLLPLALGWLPLASAQVHVDDDAAPGGDGTTWATAFRSLDAALNVATAGQQVWVAEGTYVPSVERVAGDPRSVSFAPARGVRMYGGFVGSEVTRAGRLGSAEQTVLDGSIGDPADPTDNAYHVVYLDGPQPTFHVMDRFRIRHGYANGVERERFGGGVFLTGGHKTITGCVFEFNYALLSGGGLHAATNGGTSIALGGCTFRWNRSESFGGALTSSLSYNVVNTLFQGNSAGATGGAVSAFRGNTDPLNQIISRYQNCVFVDNRAKNGGAVFLRPRSQFLEGGMIEFSGCTFARNVAIENGSAIGAPPTVSLGTSGAKTDVHNCIFWGNLSRGMTVFGGDPNAYRVVDYSLIQGGWPGAGNVSQNPRFVDLAAFDLRLSPGSPAIDAGSNALILRDDLDLNGNGFTNEPTLVDFGSRRRRDDDPLTLDTGAGVTPVVDMGAYEF